MHEESEQISMKRFNRTHNASVFGLQPLLQAFLLVVGAFQLILVACMLVVGEKSKEKHSTSAQNLCQLLGHLLQLPNIPINICHNLWNIWIWIKQVSQFSLPSWPKCHQTRVAWVPTSPLLPSTSCNICTLLAHLWNIIIKITHHCNKSSSWA